MYEFKDPEDHTQGTETTAVSSDSSIDFTKSSFTKWTDAEEDDNVMGTPSIGGLTMETTDSITFSGNKWDSDTRALTDNNAATLTDNTTTTLMDSTTTTITYNTTTTITDNTTTLMDSTTTTLTYNTTTLTDNTTTLTDNTTTTLTDNTTTTLTDNTTTTLTDNTTTTITYNTTTLTINTTTPITYNTTTLTDNTTITLTDNTTTTLTDNTTTLTINTTILKNNATTRKDNTTTTLTDNNTKTLTDNNTTIQIDNSITTPTDNKITTPADSSVTTLLLVPTNNNVETGIEKKEDNKGDVIAGVIIAVLVLLCVAIAIYYTRRRNNLNCGSCYHKRNDIPRKYSLPPREEIHEFVTLKQPVSAPDYQITGPQFVTKNTRRPYEDAKTNLVNEYEIDNHIIGESHGDRNDIMSNCYHKTNNIPRKGNLTRRKETHDYVNVKKAVSHPNFHNPESQFRMNNKRRHYEDANNMDFLTEYEIDK